MKRALQATNDFITKYPMVAISIVCALFVAIWYFFLRKGAAASVGVNKGKLTKELPAYLAIADTIENAFGLNDDEDAIFRALAGLNPDELRAVFNAYGERELFWTNDITAPYGSLNLISALKAKLNNSEQQRMAQVWAGTGLWQLPEVVKHFVVKLGEHRQYAAQQDCCRGQQYYNRNSVSVPEFVCHFGLKFLV